MTDRVTVWECLSCEGRGPTPDGVRHLIICSDRQGLRPLSFELGAPVRSLF